MTDRDLLHRLERGDDAAAFEELVRGHAGRLMSVARRLLGNQEDARDVVQETFLAAVRNIDRFEGRAKLSTWLHRIAVNAALMKRRGRRARPEESIDDLLPNFDETGHHRVVPAKWQERPDDALEREETRAAVREAIDRLPDAYRTVLMLRDIEGLDTAEVSEVLGITANAVKIRLHRARLALRTLLAPRFGEVSS